MMCVMQARHFFVRLFGLGHKVVIFDEVHAYDTYMSAIFQRLLAWLRAVGASVIVLSATLPAQTRQNLVAAWNHSAPIPLPAAPYPRLTFADARGGMVHPLPKPASRTVTLQPIGIEPGAVIAHLHTALLGGGCAAIVCNRVRRAQEIYQAVKDSGLFAPEELILFHARFPFAWRQSIEESVLEKFGKNGGRPQRAVVIATQVIEQSLDLDFDFMISDLAPVDLLIQRIGRLQRHPSRDDHRPPGLSRPVLGLAWPDNTPAGPNFGDDEYVYDRSELLRTWIALQGRMQIVLPDQIDELIEQVYGETLAQISPEMIQMLQAADAHSRRKESQEILQARSRLVPKPQDEDLLYTSILGLAEDNPNIHKDFRALTRLADPGVLVICLHQTPHGLALEPDGMGAPLDLDTAPGREEIHALLQRGLNIQNPRAVQAILEIPAPAPWQHIAALQHYHPLVFDEMGQCRLSSAGLTLILSRETGLTIEKEAS
jgi:CRISPR-associated endonuclease/helicase Cas3